MTHSLPPFQCSRCGHSIYIQHILPGQTTLEGPCPVCGQPLYLNVELFMQSAMAQMAPPVPMVPAPEPVVDAPEKLSPMRPTRVARDFQPAQLGESMPSFEFGGEQKEDPPARKASPLGFILAALIGCVVVGGAGLFLWKRGAEFLPHTAAAPKASAAEGMAIQLLKVYATTDTLEAKAKLIASGEQLREQMRGFYEAKARRPEADLLGLAWSPLPSSQNDGLFYLISTPAPKQRAPLLLVFRGDPALDPYQVEHRPQMRLDWEAMVQEWNATFEAFLANPSQPEPQKFRVVLERQHHPDDYRISCVKVRGMLRPKPDVLATLPSDPVAQEKILAQLPWQERKPAIIQLQWVDSPKGKHPHVAELVQWRWNVTQ